MAGLGLFCTLGPNQLRADAADDSAGLRSAADLRRLSAQVLPPPRPAPGHRDVEELRRDLGALKDAILAAEADPATARLQALSQRRQSAEAAFGRLKARLEGSGASRLSGDLEDRIAPLWQEVDRAVSSRTSRAADLGAAKSRIDAALEHAPRGHEMAVTVEPIREVE